MNQYVELVEHFVAQSKREVKRYPRSKLVELYDEPEIRPMFACWEDQMADEAGQPRFGEL